MKNLEYENLEIAGRMAIEDLKLRRPKNMKEYLEKVGKKIK